MASTTSFSKASVSIPLAAWLFKTGLQDSQPGPKECCLLHYCSELPLRSCTAIQLFTCTFLSKRKGNQNLCISLKQPWTGCWTFQNTEILEDWFVTELTTDEIYTEKQHNYLFYKPPSVSQLFTAEVGIWIIPSKTPTPILKPPIALENCSESWAIS